MVRNCLLVFVVAGLLVCSGCIKPKITLFPDSTEPLKERTLQGKGKEKILIIPISGFISDNPKGLPLARRQSVVQEVTAHLNKAKKDKNVKAVILKIDSPGGSVTASDLLYHELTQFKEKSGDKVVAVMMGVAASGGYYISLPADFVLAHPTTVTGSVGVVFLRPNVSGLMNKIGVEIETDKSGKNKDMGSPFRKATKEEEQMMQGLIDDMAGRFLGLVEKHRRLSPEAKANIATARVYGADEALRIGLVDQVGYLDDAIRKAANLAGIPEDSKVVVYRRTKFPDDNLYNSSTNKSETPEIKLMELGFEDSIPPFRSGFYYLWMPGQTD